MLQERGSAAPGGGWNDGGFLPGSRHLLWSRFRHSNHPRRPALRQRTLRRHYQRHSSLGLECKIKQHYQKCFANVFDQNKAKKDDMFLLCYTLSAGLL